jgi:hypothetical protein
MKASKTIGFRGDAITFAVEYFVTDGDRTRWSYKVTAADGTFLTMGMDLFSPNYCTADHALQTLIGFCYAAADPGSGYYDHNFVDFAVEAFDAIIEDLALAVLAFDEEEDLVLADPDA